MERELGKGRRKLVDGSGSELIAVAPAQVRLIADNDDITVSLTLINIFFLYLLMNMYNMFNDLSPFSLSINFYDYLSFLPFVVTV